MSINKNCDASTEKISEKLFPYSKTFALTRQPLPTAIESLFVFVLNTIENKEHKAVIFQNKDLHLTFTYETIMMNLNISRSNVYTMMIAATRELKEVTIHEYKKSESELINLFKEVNAKNGKLRITVNGSAINKYLFNDRIVSSLNVDEYLSISKKHARHLYLLIHNIRKIDAINIKLLYFSFGIIDKNNVIYKSSYTKQKVFIQRCLREPILELDNRFNYINFKKNNDGSFGIDTIFISNEKYVKINFSIERKHKKIGNLYDEVFSNNDDLKDIKDVFEIIENGTWLEGNNNINLEALHKLCDSKDLLEKRGYCFDRQFYLNLSLAMSYYLTNT